METFRHSQGPASSTDAGDTMLANDELMVRVQEAFDATTRLTHTIKKTGQEIMAVADVTEQGMTMVFQGRELIKTMSEPTEQIENILTMNRSRVTVKLAVDALQAACIPFTNLEKFLKELQALHKIYAPKKEKKSK